MPQIQANIRDLRAAYDEMLRETCGDRDGYINIGNLRYDVVNVFRSIDRIAYDIGLYDYIDAMGYVETDTEDIYELVED